MIWIVLLVAVAIGAGLLGGYLDPGDPDDYDYDDDDGQGPRLN